MYNNHELQSFYNNEFYNTLLTVQERLTKTNSTLFSPEFFKTQDEEQKRKIRGYIGQYVRLNDLTVPNIPNQDVLTDLLFKDMVGNSVLTDPIEDEKDMNEEIDINSWEDCEVIHRNGEKEKIAHFCNPQHARDILSRMAQYSGQKMDEAMPMVEANLRRNTRFVAMQSPLIDDESGVSASIRIVRPANFERQFFLDNGTATAAEMKFIELALKYGISILFIGETSSGKTTLMNCALGSVPLGYRVYTIETGSRELSLIKRAKDGTILNSIVSTLSRLSDDKTQNIDQELLVEKALRFNPNIVAVGEMRGIESAAAVEVALTDHTVVSSLHAPTAEIAHVRISQLYNKRYPIDSNVAMQMAAQAFPLVVSLKCLPDHTRHIMSITECVTSGLDGRIYRPLFGYNVTSNKRDDLTGKIIVTGKDEVYNTPSEQLIQKLRNQGILDDELESLKSVELTAA